MEGRGRETGLPFVGGRWKSEISRACWVDNDDPPSPLSHMHSDRGGWSGMSIGRASCRADEVGECGRKLIGRSRLDGANSKCRPKIHPRSLTPPGWCCSVVNHSTIVQSVHLCLSGVARRNWSAVSVLKQHRCGSELGLGRVARSETVCDSR